MKLFALLLAIALGCSACSADIAAPLIGYQQGLTLQVTSPSVIGDQCLVYGVPTPTGYAGQGQTPLFLSTPKNTGAHVLQFVFNQSAFVLSPFLAPGQTTLQIDASVASNPLITFDSTKSPQGQSGAVTIYLSNITTGAVICSSQIQFTVDQPLSCLPTNGGVVASGSSQFVIPSGLIYAPQFVQQTIVQQFVTINNIDITEVIINVNQITNKTVINNIVNVLPPSPAPVNCTSTPGNPVCHQTPIPAPKMAPPAPAPTQQPCIRNPLNGECLPPVPAPTQAPCIRNPLNGECLPPVPAPTQAPCIRNPLNGECVTPTPPTVQPPATPTPTSQPPTISPPTVQPTLTPVATQTTTPPANPPTVGYTPLATATATQTPISTSTATAQPSVLPASNGASQAPAQSVFTQSFGRRL